ncbi:Glucosamine-phosphate N-acetyltransferase-like protein [Orbilia oligospora]|uniref:Glucosamine 6-phosphate N-acetyltransferase n=1 Tax=Orbilia oligospora TaxID=2813651 RepID=A0A8H2DV53_ORBOL|nr:Glucosamine-phosphate N-acetyltransferase-like protein [Orbilia oligospora]KAF3234277.1 Glucosamine-phosphate N-acetyltransferase-like protein [Orbilia oligospora]KAF3236957.1 Glucosamine-phosphate N-acetyltransferase-like protein [Orbilia oligospora]KAF3279714.1 Glucosamine-phosphate N-acetyltransferase-like protein [Orbilia oligospora]TGJ65286.1 Glucosamine-phosphate N-acetyltransferase-like protein [Orbilia oligospora]
MSKTASLPSEITAALPLGYTIRELQKTDKAEVLEVLTVLTTVGDITNAAWDERFEYISKHDDTYTILCIVDDGGKVCATGSLIIERKFIRNCGLVGHIEDIAVAKDQQGKKLGLRMINALDHIAEKAGCYKSILDCSENNRGFYEKCGFRFAGIEMAHYYNK